MDDFISVEIPVFVDSELILSGTGELKLVSFVSTDKEEEMTEIERPFDDLIDNLIDYYRYENEASSLYKIAKELHLYADLIEGTASHMNGLADMDMDSDWPFESDALDTTTPDYDQLDR
jgi:hypothetical protein